MRNPHSAIVFSDLDGCLLNHGDYSYVAAEPALARLRAAEIPLVLVSSKTEAEMRPLADQLQLTTPMVCENGGMIAWREFAEACGSATTVLGVRREDILEVLRRLHKRYQFRSFDDLGVSGIVELTGLSRPQAERAAQRMTNEPLVWDDQEDALNDFRTEVTAAGLTLTRGGRFWHVAGPVSKRDGMIAVLRKVSESTTDRLTTVALGDSPIDAPMLAEADCAIIVPAPDGSVRMELNHPHKTVAPAPGAEGWNAAIHAWMDGLPPANN